jgi:probable F420-dependent oxidoreductase
MLSEHVVLGPSAGAAGRMENPRDYAAPGNQDPDTPWPDSVVLAAAIAARTTTLRVALAAIIAPLRHPLLLAKQLATLDLLAGGRLVVQPTVSWAEEEYAALGVPFRQRGAILDEQLAAMHAAWTQTPAAFAGEHFAFSDVYCEPRPFHAGGPRMWFGGQSLHPALLRRIARYGSGFHPFGTPTDTDLARLAEAMRAAGRDVAELELVGGIRGRFDAPDAVADLDEALAGVPAQLARGFESICFKPSMYTDDPAEVGAISRRVVEAVAAAAGSA